MEYALLIYRYFIAHNAPHEISVSYRKRKDVMRALGKSRTPCKVILLSPGLPPSRHLVDINTADPQLDTFDGIEASAMSALQVHFTNFKVTPEFLNASKQLLVRKNSGNLPELSTGRTAPGGQQYAVQALSMKTSASAGTVGVSTLAGPGMTARASKHTSSLGDLFRSSCFPTLSNSV